MNKLPFVILLLLLVGVAGAFAVWTGEDGPQISVHEAPLPGEGEAEPAKADEMMAPPGDEMPAAEPDADLPEGLDAIARQEVAGGQGELRYLVVQVWNGKPGVPAAATDVFFLDGFEGPELGDPYAQHWSSLAEGRGQKFKTDSAGQVQLPPVESWAMVTAQGAGTYGCAKVGRKHRKVETILLQADETLTVRVVDGEDRPAAGVPVGVAQRVPVKAAAPAKFQDLLRQMRTLEQQAADIQRYIKENPGQRAEVTAKMNGIRERQRRVRGELGRMKRAGAGKGKGKGKRPGQPRRALARAEPAKPKITARTEVRARRRTDSSGLAVFRHFQIYRRQQAAWWPQQYVDQFQAVLLMPLQQPEAASFSGRPAPTETLELRLPPTGSIALRTVDLDGRPFTHPVRADLRLHDAESVPWARLSERKAQNQTEIVFPFVGLGLRFTARCRLDDSDFRWTLPPFSGPINAGERVTIDVVVAPKEGMLFGRLLDRDSKPLAGARPTFLINSGAGRLEGEEVVLDKDGRFHLPYQVRDKHRGPFRLEIRHDDVKPIAGLVMALPRIPAGRVPDLGDLHIEDFGRIAFGTVTDDVGQPLRGANVQLQRQRDVGGEQPRLAFVDEAFVTDRTDASGRYELYGTLEPGRYRLRVQAKNHFPHDSRDLRAGEQLDLQLLRNSKVVGTVLTPAWLPSRNLRIVLQSVLDPKFRREDQIHDYKGKKYIYFDRVRPGTYTVSIRVQDFPDPIQRIDALEIRPGQQDLHPRLRDIDLGVLLHRFEVTAVDENGRAMRPSWPLLARIVRPGGQSSLIGFPWKGPKLEVISTTPDLHVVPLADGYQADPVVLVAGINQLQFRKVPPVILHLPGLRGLVGSGLVWVAMRLESGAPGSQLPRALDAWDGRSKRISGMFARKRRAKAGKMLGQNDSLQVAVNVDGSYRVMAYLLATGKARKARPVGVELGKVQVRLVPGSGPLRVTVPVNAEKVAKALAELAQHEASGVVRKRVP